MSNSTQSATDRNLASTGVDGLVLGAALTLPWSTSATSVFIVLVILLLPFSTGARPVANTLLSAAGGTPVALVALAAAGIAWSSANWAENLGAWDSYGKLLLIPPLLVHFRSSPYGTRIMAAFLLSCCVLLVLAWTYTLWSWQDIPTTRLELMAPVKNSATQIREFMLAGVAFMLLAATNTGSRPMSWTVAFYLAAAWFLISALYMASVTHALETLTTLVVLIALLGWHFGRSWSATIAIGVLAAATLAWAVTPQANLRLTLEHRSFFPGSSPVDETWRGGRGEFLQQAVGFISQAPVFGHGTGTTQDLYRAAKLTGTPQNITINPHQQTLAVGIQLGACGMLLLWAMWLAHLRLFLCPHPLAWAGLLIVGQTIAGSLFDSLLFDFTEGWLYVIAVGVIGGMVARSAVDLPPPTARRIRSRDAAPEHVTSADRGPADRPYGSGAPQPVHACRARHVCGALDAVWRDRQIQPGHPLRFRRGGGLVARIRVRHPKHPPFAAWLLRGWFSIFPVSDWAYYLLAMVSAGIALWFAWLILARYCDGEKRVLGIAVLCLVPFYNFHALKFDHNTVLLPLWAATTYWFLRSFESRKPVWAALAGAGAAATMLAKYWSIYLLIGLGVAALVDQRRRMYFRSAAPWVTTAVGALLLTPHVAWLMASEFNPISYAIGAHELASFKAALVSAAGYLAGSAGYVAVPVLLVLAGEPTGLPRPCAMSYSRNRPTGGSPRSRSGCRCCCRRRLRSRPASNSIRCGAWPA